MSAADIHCLLETSAGRMPGRIAVIDPGHGEISYAELDRLSGLLRDYLHHIGVGAGDRVGFFLRKSIDSVVSIYGILKAGAAYVPVDPGAPAARNTYIFANCFVRAVIVHQRFAETLRVELQALGADPVLIIVPDSGESPALRGVLEGLRTETGFTGLATHRSSPDDLAYILYTSGSTGKPKGVMLTQRNALSFLDWCAETFQLTEQDRCSSHAPLHFDLSILDIHLPIKHGAAVVLIDEKTGKDAARLAPLIAEQRITTWYSAPSILALLAQYGGLGQHDYSALRQILFAGEVFPVKHLRTLQQLLPRPRYYNLYGPTETNVCTYHEIPKPIPEDRNQPYPIGRCCSHLECRVVDEHDMPVAQGAEGELVVRGSAVTQGYWNLPEQNARAFLTDTQGALWYRTGDLVIEDKDDNYVYLGRRDRMVKKRGYRIELGEIESCLYQHSDVEEAGVIAVPDEDYGVRIKAFVGARDEKRLSVIALKAFCAERLPSYMVPDLFVFPPRLPRTSTDKIDYQALKVL